MFLFSFLISFFSLFLFFSLSYSCSIILFSSLISFCSFLSNIPMFPHLCFFLFCQFLSAFPLFSKISSCSFRQLFSSFLLISRAKLPLSSPCMCVCTHFISLSYCCLCFLQCSLSCSSRRIFFSITHAEARTYIPPSLHQV